LKKIQGKVQVFFYIFDEIYSLFASFLES